MSGNSVRFLESSASLARQVAEAVWAGAEGTPVDLRETEVWVPTAGAARRIRLELARLAAERGTGIFPPRFVQPMAALLPDGAVTVVASRAEREGAWARVLRASPVAEIEALFPRRDAFEGDRQALGAGGMLCELADLLAEAGLDFASPEVAKVCSEDGERWGQLADLLPGYLAELKRCGVEDPNRLRQGACGGGSVRRLVIAGVSDLPLAAERCAVRLSERGVEVDVLVWKPGTMGGGFDEWGRPLTAEWTECEVPVAAEQLVGARDPDDEAERVLDFSNEAAGDFAVVLADGDLTTTFRAEVLRRGGRAFVPEGDRLATSEGAVVFSEWLEWVGGGRLRSLRRLLECPRFAGWIGGIAELSVTDLVAAVDFLRAEVMAETLGQVRGFLREPAPESDRNGKVRAMVGRLVEALGGVAEVEAPEVVARCWADGGEGRVAAGQVLELWRGIDESAVFRDWPEGRDAAFARALATAKIFDASSEPGEVELLGWLESPWVEARRLAVAGCVEGRLPASVMEHAFLPDSRRARLGILDNAGRAARDAYLLTCLLRARDAAEFRCSFSKVAAEGGPALPSSLLLRCGDAELPERVREVFGRAAGAPARPIRENGWRWRLPEPWRKASPVKISPTDFSQYLACPFRFYFGRVLHAEAFDPRVREMDALKFGSLVHKALEEFGRSTPEESDAGRIEELVIGHLAVEARALFGPSPSPTVRVQLEAVKARLREFATAQAAERAAGWTIIWTERKLEADGPDPLRLGGLALSAKVDRIERHPEHGLRVLDYKSYATPKTPAESHLGSPAGAAIEAALVSVGSREKAWKDLQLPLYRRITEHWYPGESVRVGYFVLPADPSLTAVEEWDLDDELYASALGCAEAVAERVGRGVFWPPKEWKNQWADPVGAIFAGGSPDDCVAAGTIEFLEGRA